ETGRGGRPATGGPTLMVKVMKKKAIFLIFLAIQAALMGCQETKDEKPSLSATEAPEYQALLQASGASYFERKLPEDLKSSDWVYVALAYPDGEKEDILGVSEQGVEFTSDTVKVYFFEEKFGGLPFVAMQVSDNTMGHGATKYASKDEWKAKIEGKKVGELYEPMIRFSTKNRISSIGGSEIPEGCFDLILYIDPNQPKS
ncbi:MAG: hypothetical protein ACLFUF_04965, partial [Opitutales bacterium]